MALDRDQLASIFGKLGALLKQPTQLCLIGSAPSIFAGQPARQTQDIDVWHPLSTFDAGDFAAACLSAGVLFDPTGVIAKDDIYVQIVRPGIVALPTRFETEILARFGQLTIVMPPPVLIAAAKTTRASDTDLQDIVWWMRARRFGLPEIRESIALLPNMADRETALENLVVVKLVMGHDT